MKTPQQSARPWFAAIGVVPLALALTGCFGGPSIPNLPGGSGPDDVDEDLVEQIVEGGTEGDVDFEMGELPEGFPSEVPLVDGRVYAGFAVPGSDGKSAWQVTILAPDEATANQADDLLLAAGYSNESVIGYENESYLVVIVSTMEADEGGWQVSYLVTQQ